MYNQEYTELYQPSVVGHDNKVWDEEAIRNSRVYNVVDSSNNRQANAWPNPADHFSVLRTFMGAASYVVGSHSFRGGATLSNGDWRELQNVDRRHAADHLQRRRPVSVTLRLPYERNNGIKRDLGIYVQDRWSLGRITVNAGVRFDQFIGETRESTVMPSRHGAGATFGECPDGQWDPGELCTGDVQNWKDISPRVGFAMDVFGNGRTAIKASWARYVAGQQIAFVNQVNPIGALTATDTRPWTDLDAQRPAARRQRQHPVQRARAVGVDAHLRPTDGADHAPTRPTCCAAGASAATTTRSRSRCSTSSPIACR